MSCVIRTNQILHIKTYMQQEQIKSYIEKVPCDKNKSDLTY